MLESALRAQLTKHRDNFELEYGTGGEIRPPNFSATCHLLRENVSGFCQSAVTALDIIISGHPKIGAAKRSALVVSPWSLADRAISDSSRLRVSDIGAHRGASLLLILLEESADAQDEIHFSAQGYLI